MRYFYVASVAAMSLSWPSAHAQAPAQPTRQTHCSTQAAARFHGIEAYAPVLEAIIQVESRGDPLAFGRNSNGSVDVGMAGINSVHFPALARKGVHPDHLFDPCVARYVAAQRLADSMRHYPADVWRGIGAYHSKTPACNERYQVLVFNQLVTMGVRKGPQLPLEGLGCGPKKKG